MKLSIPVVQTIQKRHSVRTYEERALSPQERAALVACMDRLDNPFGVPVHEYILDKRWTLRGKVGYLWRNQGSQYLFGRFHPQNRAGAVGRRI